MDGALTSTRCRILGVHLFDAECSCFSALRSNFTTADRTKSKKCCTLHDDARVQNNQIQLWSLRLQDQVRHCAEHAVARKSCTQCATIANERFVTGFGLPRVQLASSLSRLTASRRIHCVRIAVI